MSEINIKTCGYCSNSDALEAVSKWMKDSGSSRGYREIRRIITESGVLIKVRELHRGDWDTTCNGSFEVTRLDV